MGYVNIDSFVVLLAALLNMTIGLCWYSKWLFGALSKKLSDHRRTEMNLLNLIYMFAVSLTIAYFISYFSFHLGVNSPLEGMYLGFRIWLGFIATIEFSSHVWNQTPLKLFLIDVGYRLVSFLAMSGLISA